jgi:hypothetical protein
MDGACYNYKTAGWFSDIIDLHKVNITILKLQKDETDDRIVVLGLDIFPFAWRAG